MTDRYESIGRVIGDAVLQLRTQGWDPGCAQQLVSSLAQIGEDATARDDAEILGRVETLAKTLQGLLEGSVDNGRLDGALRAAACLVTRLHQVQHPDGDTDILPAHSADWSLVLLGEGLQLPQDLARSLSAFGFNLVRANSFAALPADLTPHWVGIAQADWLAAQPALPVASWVDGFFQPVLLGVAADAYQRLQAYPSGAQCWVGNLCEVRDLLAPLAGLAWMPARPYQILLVDMATPARHQQAERLRQAKFVVTCCDNPTAIGQVPLEPDVLALNLAQFPDANWAAWMPEVPVLPLASWAEVPAAADPLVILALRHARQQRQQQLQRRREVQTLRHLDRLHDALNAHAIVSITDAGGAIIHANDKFCRISGYSRKELLGRDHRMMKSGQQPPTFFQNLWNTVRSGRTWHGVVKNYRKDGQTYWAQCTIVPCLDANGQPAEYIAIRTDITAQRQMLDELKQQQRLFEMLRRGLQHYIIHDDLRGAAEILLGGMLTLTASEYGFLGEVLYDGDEKPTLRLHALTDIAWDEETRQLYAQEQGQDLVFNNPANLFGAVLHSGQTVIANDPSNDLQAQDTPLYHPPVRTFLGVPVHLGRTLTGMVGLANRPTGYQESIAMALAPLTDTYAILIESARLRGYQNQVIDELDRGRTLAEAALQTETVQRTELLRVVNNGLLALQERTMVLEKCQRLNGADMRYLDALCATLEHLARQIETSHPTTTAADATSAVNTAPARRILVAEDDPTNQATLRIQLAHLGMVAEIVSNGRAALTAWQTGTWDLILSDYYMPEMDGPDLARAIRQAEYTRGGRIPIIAITVGEPEMRDACLVAGMDATLAKPFTLEALSNLLKQWLTEPNSAITAAALPALSMAGRFDLERLHWGLGLHNPEQVRELLQLFIETASGDLGLCSTAVNQGQLQNLAAIAHKLKAAAQTVGAQPFAEQIVLLEQWIRVKDLEQVRACLRHLEALRLEIAAAVPQVCAAAAAHGPLPEDNPSYGYQPRRALVVDDDAVTRRQLSLLLKLLGAAEVLTANHGKHALQILDAHPDCDLLICDLHMPEMDGVQFLRHLKAREYRGGLILASGIEDRLLRSALELATIQGLNVYGALNKPVTRQALAALFPTEKSAITGTVTKPIPQISVKDIVEAMYRDDFLIYFQPKVDAVSLRPVGVEALARWLHPSKGFIPPDYFIDIAEREGIIGVLSEHLFKKTFQSMSQILGQTGSLTLAVNLSAAWLNEIHLPESLQASTQDHGLRAENIILELTETGVMADPRTALDVMTRLRMKGFRLSLDDFGVGYSSMQQLQRFPFSEMKLDRGFVQSAGHDPAARAILASSVQIARQLNLRTVAEGVETQAELDLMRALGCDLIQGWLIAKAMPMDVLLDWLNIYRQVT